MQELMIKDTKGKLFDLSRKGGITRRFFLQTFTPVKTNEIKRDENLLAKKL